MVYMPILYRYIYSYVYIYIYIHTYTIYLLSAAELEILKDICWFSCAVSANHKSMKTWNAVR